MWGGDLVLCIILFDWMELEVDFKEWAEFKLIK